MNVMKRAWKGVLNQPAKSVILLITIVILGTLIAGAVSLKQGIVHSQRTMSQKVKIYAYITLKNAASDSATVRQLTEAPVLDSGVVDQLKALPQVRAFETTRYLTFSTGKMVSGTLGAGTSVDASFRVFGIEGGNLLDYTSGDIHLINGRWLTPEDENSSVNPVVIAQTVAEKNRLTVGSQFTLETTLLGRGVFGDYEPNREFADATRTTFTIVGTYGAADKYITQSNGLLFSISSYLNMNMYTTRHALEPALNTAIDRAATQGSITAQAAGGTVSYGMMSRGSAGFSTVPTFTLWLKDRGSADAFAEAAAALLPAEYEVTVTTDVYDQTMSPLQNLSWIVDLIIAAAVVTTVAMLGLVVLLMLRTRKTELGTLYSLGERKARIAFQMVVEVLVVAAIGLSVSVFTGSKLTQGISGQLVKGEVTKLLQSQGSSGTSVDATALNDMSKMTSLELSGETVILIYLAGMLTAGVATLIPVVLTLRRPPKDIIK